jgi:hypothetical protein
MGVMHVSCTRQTSSTASAGRMRQRAAIAPCELSPSVTAADPALWRPAGRPGGPKTIRPRNSSTDWSRRSMASENNWFEEVLAARTSGNADPDVPYGQLSASENRDPGRPRAARPHPHHPRRAASQAATSNARSSPQSPRSRPRRSRRTHRTRPAGHENAQYLGPAHAVEDARRRNATPTARTSIPLRTSVGAVNRTIPDMIPSGPAPPWRASQKVL